MIDNTDKLKLVSLALNCRDFVPVKGVRNKDFFLFLLCFGFFFKHTKESVSSSQKSKLNSVVKYLKVSHTNSQV